ncbi:MAG: hypothetical protein QXW98_05135 [Candidatus Caldarchaeum sp.]
MLLPIIVDEKEANNILHALFNTMQREALLKLLKTAFADATLLAATNPNKWWLESSDAGTNTSSATGLAAVTIGTLGTPCTNSQYSLANSNSVGSVTNSSFANLSTSNQSTIQSSMYSLISSSDSSSIFNTNFVSILSSSNSSVSASNQVDVSSSDSASISSSALSSIYDSSNASMTSCSYSSLENSINSNILASSSSFIKGSFNSNISFSNFSSIETSSQSGMTNNSRTSIVAAQSANAIQSNHSAVVASIATSLANANKGFIAASEKVDITGAPTSYTHNNAIISSENISLNYPPASTTRQCAVIACSDGNFTSSISTQLREVAFIASRFFNNLVSDSFYNLERCAVIASNQGSIQNANSISVLSGLDYNVSQSTRSLVACGVNNTLERVIDSAIIASSNSSITNVSFSIINNAIIGGTSNVIEGSNYSIQIGSNNYTLGAFNSIALGFNNNPAISDSIVVGFDAVGNRDFGITSGFRTTRAGPARGKVQKIEYANSLVTTGAGTFQLPGAFELSPAVANGGSNVLWHVEVVANAMSSDGLQSASFVRRRLYRRQFLPTLQPIAPVDAVLNVSQRGSNANNPPTGWAATINHDTTLNTVRIDVTSPAGVTIYWDAFITIYQTVLP